MKEHIGIIVPGLGNNNHWLEWSAKQMDTPSFKTVIFDPQWIREGKQIKVEALTQQAKIYLNRGHSVSLIGSSASGSLALTVFHMLQKEITAGIAICACLRTPKHPSLRLESNLTHYPAHKKTVSLFESIEPYLIPTERKRILTLRPLWDRVVPTETMTVKYATNKQMIIGEHVPSIAAALTFYANTIKTFIFSVDK